MGTLTGHLLTSERRATVENPLTPLSAPNLWLTDWLGGQPTSAGPRISEANALTCGVLFAVVRVVAETMATVPLLLYRRKGARGRERARNHPLYRLLHDEPNPRMSAFTWREMISGHLETWGNSYTEIERAANGAVLALWPRRPDRIEIRERNGQLWYLLDEQPGKGPRAIPSRSMLHVPGLGYDGVRGYSPVALHREALGWNKGLEAFGAGWVGRGGRPSGILSYPGRLKPEAKQAIKSSWDQQHQGPSRSGGVAVLEEGLSWTQVGLPPEDGQFIQSKRFSVEDVARIWRMQLHKIQSLDKATFSNIEQQSIEHVTDTVLPRAARLEHEINRKLISRAERDTYFAEHLLAGLFRGDIKSRYDAYAVGRQWGWMSADDVRELENLNPLPRGQGDMYMVPLNMVPADQLAATDPPPPDPPPTDPPDDRRRGGHEIRSQAHRRRIQRSMRRLFERVALGFTRQETDQVRKAVKRYVPNTALDDLREWLREYYGPERYQRAVAQALLPVLQTFAEQLAPVAADEISGDVPDNLDQLVRGYAENVAVRHASSHRDQLLQLMEESPQDEMQAALDTRLDEWREKAPAKIASRETVEAGGAIAKAVWISGGVQLLRWVGDGENCSLCEEMDGRVVGIEDGFLTHGDVIDPIDGTAPLVVRQNYGHPPLHQGCDCTIIPG